MNSRKDNRNRRLAHLPTALLSLALFAGFASVGQAEEIPSLVITAERPIHTDFSSSIRNEMRERTEVSIWMTRIEVGTDLNLKLSRRSQAFRMAVSDANKRG